MSDFDEEFPEDRICWMSDNVAVTNFYTAHSDLRSSEIRAVLCLDADLRGGSAAERGLEVVEVIGLVDGENSPVVFSEAVESLATLVKRHGKVLVHCRAGKSRSLAVAAAYLVRSEGLSPDAALTKVCERRESHQVAIELVALLHDYASDSE